MYDKHEDEYCDDSMEMGKTMKITEARRQLTAAAMLYVTDDTTGGAHNKYKYKI